MVSTDNSFYRRYSTAIITNFWVSTIYINCVTSPDKNIKWRNLSPLPSTAWAQYTAACCAHWRICLLTWHWHALGFRCPFHWWIVSILPALLIFWHITQIPANDRDTYPRPASELLRNVATCEARTHFWWILNSSRPANFIEVVGKNDSGSAAVTNSAHLPIKIF